MTDLEITKLCAEAMGWKHLGAVGVTPPKRGEADPKGLWCLSGGNDWWINPAGFNVCAPCQGIPDPLHDDAQAMALVKRLYLVISHAGEKWLVTTGQSFPDEGDWIANKDLNRAICECCAKIMLSRGGEHDAKNSDKEGK